MSFEAGFGVHFTRALPDEREAPTARRLMLKILHGPESIGSSRLKCNCCSINSGVLSTDTPQFQG